MASFTSVDFETSCAREACAIGVCVVENNEIVSKHYELIKPPSMYFNPHTVAVHGITAYDVEDKPQFDELWGKLKPLFDNRMVVAHNAPFDMGVLKANLAAYQITHPEFEFLCTLSLSRRLWKELPNHRLNTMADMLGVEFQHHNAIDDALVCAKLAIEILRKTGEEKFDDLATSLDIKPGQFSYPFGFEKQTKCR